MRRSLFALLALLAGTSGPLAADVTLTIENASSQSVTSVAAYPVRADGSIIDDNVGGTIDEVPAGTTVALPLQLLKCASVFVRVGLADDSELEATIDLCKQPGLRVSD